MRLTMRLLFLFLFLLLIPGMYAYTLVPHQPPALVRIWTDNGSSMKYLEQPSTFAVSSPLRFIALDTDNDGVFDRGGVPDSEETITLYPVGVIQGFAAKQTSVFASCSYPSLDFVVEGAFSIVLPAGKCSLRLKQENKEGLLSISVAANDVTQLELPFHQLNKGNIALAVFVVVLVFLGALAAMHIIPIHKHRGPPRAALAVLKPEERAVLEYLTSRGPQLAGVVRKDLAIPKTTFHRILSRLTEKNLIVEEEYGNTTKMRWNESFHPK